MGSRRERGVAHDRFRVRVRMMRVVEDHPLLQQVAKTSVAHPIEESAGRVAAKLIHCDLQDQLRRYRLRRRDARAAENAEKKQKRHAHP
jgi:hypothetical protein